MKHSYNTDCPCDRCVKERSRRLLQGVKERDRTLPQVMFDWRGSRNRRRARIANEYWDNYESGMPMGDGDR